MPDLNKSTVIAIACYRLLSVYVSRLEFWYYCKVDFKILKWLGEQTNKHQANQNKVLKQYYLDATRDST